MRPKTHSDNLKIVMRGVRLTVRQDTALREMARLRGCTANTVLGELIENAGQTKTVDATVYQTGRTNGLERK